MYVCRYVEYVKYVYTFKHLFHMFSAKVREVLRYKRQILAGRKNCTGNLLLVLFSLSKSSLGCGKGL